MVGIIPALAAAVITEDDLQRALAFGKRFADFLDRHDLGRTDKLSDVGLLRGEPGQRRGMLRFWGAGRRGSVFAPGFVAKRLLFLPRLPPPFAPSPPPPPPALTA